MNAVHTIEGSYPYFKLTNRVVYITRGFEAEEHRRGLALSEWLEVIGGIAALTPDERYEIRNPHTEEILKYRERGRARCLSSTGQPQWFSYMPRHISANAGQRLPSLRLMDRFEKVVAAVGRHPSLGEWRDYVTASRYLNLAEHVTVGKSTVPLPGRTVTVAKSGGVIVFRPSSVFIYFGPSPYTTETPDAAFLEVSKEIAGRIDAEVITEGFP
jgi:hypothetical protein